MTGNGWSRLAAAVAEQIPAAEVDGVWVFSTLRHEGREWGTAVLSREFIAMARANSGCEVLHQDFLAMQLPEGRFDGIFANASLFHVPSQELPRVSAGTSQNIEAAWCSVLVKSAREQRRRL